MRKRKEEKAMLGALGSRLEQLGLEGLKVGESGPTYSIEELRKLAVEAEQPPPRWERFKNKFKR